MAAVIVLIIIAINAALLLHREDHHDSIRNLHDAQRIEEGRLREGERKIKLGDGRLDPKSNTFLPSLLSSPLLGGRI